MLRIGLREVSTETLIVGQHIGKSNVDCYPTCDKRIPHVNGAFTFNECSGGEVRSAVDYVKDRSVRALSIHIKSMNISCLKRMSSGMVTRKTNGFDAMRWQELQCATISSRNRRVVGV